QIGGRLLRHREPAGHDHTGAAGSRIVPGGALGAAAGEPDLLAWCGLPHANLRADRQPTVAPNSAATFGAGRSCWRQTDTGPGPPGDDTSVLPLTIRLYRPVPIPLYRPRVMSKPPQPPPPAPDPPPTPPNPTPPPPPARSPRTA